MDGIKFTCPHCKTCIVCHSKTSGGTGRCLTCGEEFIIPAIKSSNKPLKHKNIFHTTETKNKKIKLPDFLDIWNCGCLFVVVLVVSIFIAAIVKSCSTPENEAIRRVKEHLYLKSLSVFSEEQSRDIVNSLSNTMVKVHTIEAGGYNVFVYGDIIANGEKHQIRWCFYVSENNAWTTVSTWAGPK